MKARQQWENSDLVFAKEDMTKKSILVKGMLGAQEMKSNPASSIRCDLERFNIWFLNGNVEEGLLTSEPLPPIP